MCPVSSIFVDVNYGRCSVLLWRRCGTVCTSGSMDDVTFAHSCQEYRRREKGVGLYTQSDCIRDSTALTPWRNRRIVKLTHHGAAQE